MTSAVRSLLLAVGTVGVGAGAFLYARPLSGPGTAVAMVIAAGVLWLGISVFWTGFRGTLDEKEPFRPGSLRRIRIATASGCAAILALGLGGVGYWAHEYEGGSPEPKELFSTDRIPGEPGKLVKAEEYFTDVPSGAEAWKITYTTTRGEDRPALATALVISRKSPPSGPRPVVAWAHGTTGIASSCAPSAPESIYRFAAIPGAANALAEGWVIVATDYTGLGTPGPHPYLVGEGEARAVLDSVRAAREFSEVDLSPRTVVWGHSQGGGAALWTGSIAPTYAPEVDVAGVVGIAPATDLPGLAQTLSLSPTGFLFISYVLTAYAAEYPDVKTGDYVVPAASTVLKQAADLCVRETEAQAALAQTFNFAQPLYTRPLTEGPLGERLRENVPSGRIAAPTLIAQGALDVLVLPNLQAAYAAQRCAQKGNGTFEYVTYPDRDHTTIVAGDSPLVPELLAWTKDRFADEPATSRC